MIEQKCNHCDKVIQGHQKTQVEYMIMQHVMSKHPEKITVKEMKK